LPSAITKTLGKAGKSKPILANFPALPSAREEGTLQRILKKISLPSATQRGHSAKNFQKKFLFRVPIRGTHGKKKFKFFFFAECQAEGHSAKNFQKKTSLPSAKKNSLPSAQRWGTRQSTR
jgi:hypothetical protein